MPNSPSNVASPYRIPITYNNNIWITITHMVMLICSSFLLITHLSTNCNLSIDMVSNDFNATKYGKKGLQHFKFRNNIYDLEGKNNLRLDVFLNDGKTV